MEQNEENHYILGNDYWTNENLWKGKVGEDCVASSCRKAFPKEFGYTVKHNNFGKQYEYACSSGVDITITKPNKPTVAMEVKALADQKKPYGTDFVRRHVLPRFNGLTNTINILAITFLHLLTEQARALLADNNIIVLATNCPLDTQFKRSSQLHILASRIAQIVKNRTPTVHYQSTTLNQYTNPSSVNPTDSRIEPNTIPPVDSEYGVWREWLSMVVQPSNIGWLKYRRDVLEE